jgi:hypothetical protein
MVMFEQQRRLSEPLRWGRREKTVVAALLAAVVLAVAALGIYAATSGAPARADCISVTFPSTLGAAELHACSTQARQICAAGPVGAYKGIEQQLGLACRHAGYPFGGG